MTKSAARGGFDYLVLPRDYDALAPVVLTSKLPISVVIRGCDFWPRHARFR